MIDPPSDLEESELLAALGHWGVAAELLEYVPRGAGSHHWKARTGDSLWFVTVDELDRKPWLGDGGDEVFDGLRAGYECAAALAEQQELSFVVAPLPAESGERVVRLRERYAVSLFEWLSDLDETASAVGRDASRFPLAERLERVRLIASIHAATASVASLPSSQPLRFAGRARLESALGDLGETWTAGPLSEPARKFVAEREGDVVEMLRRFDELVAEVDVSSGEVTAVITHGEPHPWNLVRTERAFRLVDWDTVGLAPPERDLWQLDDGSPEVAAEYLQVTGHALRPAALDAYDLLWSLADLDSYLADLRSPHDDGAWARKALRVVGEVLDGHGFGELLGRTS